MDAVAQVGPPAPNPMRDAFVGAIETLAANAGMTPQQFIFGGIGEILAPFEKQLADRIADAVVAKFKSTAEVGKVNDALQGDWIGDSPAHCDTPIH